MYVPRLVLFQKAKLPSSSDRLYDKPYNDLNERPQVFVRLEHSHSTADNILQDLVATR